MSGESTTMKLFRGAPFVILAIGVATFITLYSRRTPPASDLPENSPPVVDTEAVVDCGSKVTLETDGEVIPYREVTLAAQVGGRIVEKSLSCRAGRYVRQGDLLIRIDPRDYDLEIERIQQSIRQTAVNVEEVDVEATNTEQLIELAESELKLQQSEVQRMYSLREQKATSQSSIEASERKLLQARNAVQTLRNAVSLLQTRRGRYLREKDRLEVELEKAMLDRQRTEILAPVDGVITSDAVEQDDFVQVGTALVKIEDTAKVEVRFDLKLDELRWVWNRQVVAEAVGEDVAADSYELPPLPVDVSIRVDGRSFVWKAELSRYDGVGINPVTRTVPCVAVVSDPRSGREAGTELAGERTGPPALLRGMFVDVSIQVPPAHPLLEVPVKALRPRNQLWLVRDGKLCVSDVQVAMVQHDRVLLVPDESAVRAGDQAVVSPLALAVDGMEVRLVEQTTLPANYVAPDRASSADESVSRNPDRQGQREVAR